MAWSAKEVPTQFDNRPIDGLFSLVGDLVGYDLPYTWVKGHKLPMVAFPSGMACQLWDSNDPTNGIIHIYSEVDLPLYDTRDRAYDRVHFIAQEPGYTRYSAPRWKNGRIIG